MIRSNQPTTRPRMEENVAVPPNRVNESLDPPRNGTTRL